MAEFRQNAPSGCHCCTYIHPWLLIRLAGKRATTCKSNDTFENNIQLSSTNSTKACCARSLPRPQIRHPGVCSLSRTGAGRKAAPTLRKFPSSHLPFNTDKGAKLLRFWCPTPDVVIIDCEAYTHAGLALAEAGVRSCLVCGKDANCVQSKMEDIAAILQLGDLATQEEHT